MRHRPPYTLLGLGVSITSPWLVAEGRMLHLTPERCAAPLPVYLIYPYSSFFPAKLPRFVEALREGRPTGMGLPSSADLAGAA